MGDINNLEAKQLKLKVDTDESLFCGALTDLGNTAAQKRNTGLSNGINIAGAGSALFQACYLVGKAMHINVSDELTKLKEAIASRNLSDIAQAFNMKYRQVALRGEWWNKDNGPLLAYMDDDERPVALIPVSPKRYRMHDPVKGITAVVNKETAHYIKPFAYTFYSAVSDKKLSIIDVLVDSAKSLWKSDILIIVLMGIAGGLLSIVMPVAMGLMFDEIIPQGQRVQYFYAALFLGAGAFGRLMFQFVQSVAIRRFGGKMDSSLQTAVWNRLLDLPVAFFKSFTAGELAMKALNIGKVRKILSKAAINSILSAIFSIPNILLLFYYNAGLALKVMIFSVLALGVTVIFSILQIKYDHQEMEMENKIGGLVFQIIGGIGKLRVSGSEKRGFSLWAQQYCKLRRLSCRSMALSNIFSVFSEIYPLVTSIAIFHWIGRGQNNVTIGIFTAFNAAFLSVLISTLSLSGALMKISRVAAIFESARPIYEALPEYNKAREDPGDLAGDIEVNHISFRYESKTPLILNDVSLRIHPGEYVAIVGPSGSGKSTLLRILLGFEKPEVGKVYYNGQDMSGLDARKIRKQIGVVLQNSSLMSGDIYSNIVGPHVHLTMEDAWEAARKAGIEQDILKMPMGMQSILAEGGSTLSGGQRQRLFIARAIVNKPNILYFDEATSALDNKTQAIVSQGLDGLNVTRVIIAHRLSTIINCDRIIVLDKGRIIEEGSYSELMANKGLFSEMAERQLA